MSEPPIPPSQDDPATTREARTPGADATEPRSAPPTDPVRSWDPDEGDLKPIAQPFKKAYALYQLLQRDELVGLVRLFD